MRLLFAHPAFPGQFENVVKELYQRGHSIKATVCGPATTTVLAGKIEVASYQPTVVEQTRPHPWLVNLQPKLQRARGFLEAAQQLRNDGFEPDIVIAHSGWGEAIYYQMVWPEAKLVLYCEWYDQEQLCSKSFDPSIAKPAALGIDTRCQVAVTNISQDIQLGNAIAAWSPTNHQRLSYPPKFLDKISVFHEGVDTLALRPSNNKRIRLSESLILDSNDHVVTYVARSMEPIRGFHIFLEALPEVLSQHLGVHILVIGGEQRGYGAMPDDEDSWFSVYSRKLHMQLTESQRKRVHFLGLVDRQMMTECLQISRVHVYLTYPFTLSWSLIEAMAVGCSIVASDNPPVTEVLTDGINALLVPFHDDKAVSSAILTLLQDGELSASLGRAAVNTAREKFDSHNVCIPRLADWIESLEIT